MSKILRKHLLSSFALLSKETSLLRSKLSSHKVCNNYHALSNQFRYFSQRNKSLLKDSFSSNNNNNGKKGFGSVTMNDFRLVMICVALVSIAVGAYYSNKSTERKIEYKEKVREERKQSIENMKGSTKEFFGRFRRQKTEEEPSVVNSEEKKD
ncbi:hypothetical protein FDP41_001424 [Naegleria fowleri]|uniref:Uncharacterized protein n=1 Tax=Naegleria fowleri TaxID=5763 RepID=A0A6A5C130_NAEFO|nr:uncharacterized protein FDP41_001424 [Naegleria fowleri]KAF0979560.1 hypothetical protein FDP41_001424 [Naegleria fowleri]